MKKTKFLIGAVSVICVFSLVGCNADGNNNTGKKPPVISNSTGNNDVNNFTGNNDVNNSTGDNDADSLFELSTIQGAVINFSADGCIITPLKTSKAADGGMIAKIDQPGYENPDENITIHYQSGCVFQIAKIRVSSGTATISEADISDIKKKTSLVIYGDWIDEHNLNANRIIIDRYE